MRQEFIDAGIRPCGSEFLENIFHVEPGIQVFESAAAQEGVDHGSVFCCSIGSGKEVVFSSDSHGSYRAFHGPVINAYSGANRPAIPT